MTHIYLNKQIFWTRFGRAWGWFDGWLRINKYKYQFKNLDKIGKNYSETFQDMFVLSVLNGKENGTYLEFGCNHYQKCNNTFLLETKFDWKGLSIDIDEDLIELFNKNRKNPAICQNVLETKNCLSLLDNHQNKIVVIKEREVLKGVAFYLRLSDDNFLKVLFGECGTENAGAVIVYY